MADRYLLESGAPDGYQLEDASGVLLLEVPDCYKTTVLADSPVLYWRLGEPSGTNANDETANNLDGTYQNSPTLGVTSAITGDANTAITLNGTTQYVSIADSAPLDLGDTLSIEAWVKRAANGVRHYIWSKGSQGGLFIESDERITWDNDGSICSRSNVLINDTNWHHVVATRGASVDHIYVDGVDVTVAGTNGGRSSTADAFEVGRYIGATNQFNGSIDEIAYYSVALTPTQVATHYAAAAVACAVPRVPYTNPMPPLIAQ